MTEQRWNARQFARESCGNYSGNEPDRMLVWVTADALERVNSALIHGTLDMDSAPPLPTDVDVVVGFETPLPLVHRVLPNGDLGVSAPNVVIYGVDEGNPKRAALLVARGFDADASATCLLAPGIRPLAHSIGLAREHTQHTQLPAAFGDGLEHVAQVLRAVWALRHEPVEREVSATTLSQCPIRTGKGRRARDESVSVIDVRRSTTTRSTPSGRVIERDHRWERIGHWRRQPFGKGRTQRRRIWIDPVVCGPPDKPLLTRPKVAMLR